MDETPPAPLRPTRRPSPRPRTPGSPLPLHLAEMPVIQVWGTIPRAKPGEPVPDRFWKRIVEIDGSDGHRYRIEIRADPDYGLPHNKDGLYLLAFLTLAREQQAWDGVIRDVWVRSILRLVNEEHLATGDEQQRVRDALLRLLRTTVLIQRISTPRSRALPPADLDIEAAPVVPDAAVVLPQEIRERGVHILSFDLSHLAVGPDSSQTRTLINEIHIEPIWIDLANAGWLTWIDLDLYQALPGTLARNLYALLAARASRGYFTVPGQGWSIDAHDLAEQLGLGAYEGNKLKQMIGNAAAELTGAGILDRATHARIRKGRYTFTFYPGVQLEEVDHLRGTTFFHTDEERVIYAQLVRLGIRRSAAADHVHLRRNHAALWVRYAEYIEAHPERAPWKPTTRAGYLSEAILKDYQIPDRERFAAWLEQPHTPAQAAVTEPSVHAPPPSAPAPRPRVALPAPQLPSEDPAAAAALQRFRDALLKTRPQWEFHFTLVAPVAISGSALVLACTESGEVSARHLTTEIAREALRQSSDGTLTEVQIRHV